MAAHDHGKMTMVTSESPTKTMAAGAFKTHCLAVLDEVHERGEEVIITKRGKPMVRLLPFEEKKPESLLGCMKGQFEIVGDIVSPIVEPWEWDQEVFPPEAEGPGLPELEDRVRKPGK